MYWYQTFFCYLHCNSPLKIIELVVKFFSRYRSPCPPYHLLQTNSTKQTTPAEGLIKWSFGKNRFNISSNVYYKKYWPCHKMCMKTEKKNKKKYISIYNWNLISWGCAMEFFNAILIYGISHQKCQNIFYIKSVWKIATPLDW